MYSSTFRPDLSSRMSMVEVPNFVVDDDIIEETFEQSRADRIISLTPKCRFTFDHGTTVMPRAIATGDVNGDNQTELAVGSMNGTMLVYKMNSVNNNNISNHGMHLINIWSDSSLPQPVPISLLTKYASHPWARFAHTLPAGVWALLIPFQLYYPKI